MADQPTALPPPALPALPPHVEEVALVPATQAHCPAAVSGPGQQAAAWFSQPVTPGALFRALRRCWRVAVPVGLVLGAVVGAGVWVLRPNKSTSVALIRVAQVQERLLGDAARPDYSNNYARTQQAMMRSRPVLKAALANDRVKNLTIVRKQADPLDWLEKDLKAEIIEGTEIIRLSLTSRGDAADLAPIVLAVTNAYIELNVRSEQSAQLAHLDELQKVYSAAEEKVRRAQESIQGLTRALNGGDAAVHSLKQKNMLDEYGALKRELAGVNERRRRLEVTITSHKTRLADPGAGATDLAVEREIDADPRVVAQEAVISKLREQAQRLEERSVKGTASEALRDYQRKIDDAAAVLEGVRKDRRAAAAARQAAVSRATIEGQLRETQLEFALITTQRDALQTEVDVLRREVDRVGLNSAELDLRRAELDRSDAFLKKVWDQKEQMEAELKSALRQRVSVVAPAEEASVPNRNGQLMETAAGGAGGTLLGLLAVAFRYHRRGYIQSPGCVAQGLRLPLLGSLPLLRGGRLTAGALAAHPAGPDGAAFAESADGVRTILLHDYHPGDRGVVLLVSSALPGEGKSTVAAGLASSLARTGRPTLLVDGDLRRPTLHSVLGFPPSEGLCEALTGAVAVEAAIRPTDIEHLDLMPAGVFQPAAVAGLARPAARKLFDELRARYAFVVVDSSPLLCVPDGFMLGRCVDGLVLSVRPGVSRSADVMAGYDRARDHRLPVIGAVVCGDIPTRGYYRGYAATPAAGPLVTVVESQV